VVASKLEYRDYDNQRQFIDKETPEYYKMLYYLWRRDTTVSHENISSGIPGCGFWFFLPVENELTIYRFPLLNFTSNSRVDNEMLRGPRCLWIIGDAGLNRERLFLGKYSSWRPNLYRRWFIWSGVPHLFLTTFSLPRRESGTNLLLGIQRKILQSPPLTQCCDNHSNYEANASPLSVIA